ncbi:hypothetical protein Tco_0809948 [Tanacetum coccineum]
MAESSSHNPPSPEITPKEEPATLDKLESPNTFLPVDQVSTPIGGIRGDIGIITFRNALRAHYLPYISMYVPPPSITVVRPWFETIGYCREIGVDYVRMIWEDIIHKLNKKTKEKVVSYPRFISLLLEYMMPKYDNEELTIHPTHIFSVLNWALKPN